jgi:hypothetical protein
MGEAGRFDGWNKAKRDYRGGDWLESLWRVSEWDTGLGLMQEWKFGVEGKASVCKGI